MHQEPRRRQRPRQAARQARLIGQVPQQHQPGMRHDTLTAARYLQAPRPPGSVHAESAADRRHLHHGVRQRDGLIRCADQAGRIKRHHLDVGIVRGVIRAQVDQRFGAVASVHDQLEQVVLAGDHHGGPAPQHRRRCQHAAGLTDLGGTADQHVCCALGQFALVGFVAHEPAIRSRRRFIAHRRPA